LNEIPRALNGYVVTYNGKRIKSHGGLKRSFKTTCREAGIPCGRGVKNGITFHDIRRTVKTSMLKAGVRRVYQDKILGHTLKGMDKHYLAIDGNDLHRAMDQYTEFLDGQLNVDHSVDQTHIKVS
jgi:integrase